ncbi:hypothetical protein HPB51_018927 [Rhipicephalus microplus]|uniref:Peptidase M13 N-terminal domain-containing protein n=1 Tax=Rhipicephalus microplus TaxID=6941 RepID=A0A9J6EHY1_RHIMP|nr:hypothetical protein HPB51_018927 [Rhipicephalus microplus]
MSKFRIKSTSIEKVLQQRSSVSVTTTEKPVAHQWTSCRLHCTPIRFAWISLSRRADHKKASCGAHIDKEALQSEYEATLKEELILTEGQSSDLCYSPAFMIGSVLVLFCLVTFFSGVVNQRITAGQRLKCSSKVCIHFTDLMNRSATARVPPCSDFYAHVCTEWDRDNMESPQELHFQNIMKRLYLSLYKQPIPHNSQTNFEKAAAYYQSCLRVFLDGKSELKQIVHMLREVGVNWPKRSARPDLLVMSAKLKQSLDLDSVLVLTMPDTMSLSIQPPSTSFLHDIKRQRYAIDFADNSLEQFSALWRAFSTEDLNETEVQQLLQTEKRFLNYIILAGTSPTTSARYSLSLAALPLACSEFPRGRWDTLLTEAYHVSIAKVTAINIRNRRAFDVACHLVRESGEPAILYYVEWLAVKTLATNADRSIAQLVWSHAERAPFTAQSTCFRSTMQLFGEVVLLEENRRWHLRRPTLLSEFHFVAKEVRDSLSEVIKSDGSHPSMNVFFKYLVHDNIYNNDREHLIESVYATLPDLSENFISNQMLLLNVSLNRDTIRSLGFSWEALEDMLRHDGGLADIQLTALQQDVRTFLQLSYASYFLLAEDLPAAYNFAAVGMLVARHMLAFRRHTIEMARAYTGFMHAETKYDRLSKFRLPAMSHLSRRSHIVHHTQKLKRQRDERREFDPYGREDETSGSAFQRRPYDPPLRRSPSPTMTSEPTPPYCSTNAAHHHPSAAPRIYCDPSRNSPNNARKTNLCSVWKKSCIKRKDKNSSSASI